MGSGSWSDWRNPQNNNLWQGVNGVNNPCPLNYRLPTESELEAERLSWGSNNIVGAFNSPLKLIMAGRRDGIAGALFDAAAEARYWSSTVNGGFSNALSITASNASIFIDGRVDGISVRCIKDVSAQYPANSVFCSSGPTAIVDVTNPNTGKTWMDRNLGASQAATSSNDAASYGDLYQWGRRSDGHQCRNSATTAILASTDQPLHSDFILTSNTPYDWRSPQNSNLWQGVNGINNPCPTGYRLPTETELINERQSWTQQNSAGAFNSVLKLPVSGLRMGNTGFLDSVDSYGVYWSSTFNGNLTNILTFGLNTTSIDANTSVGGESVRCIKD